jgi:hypothetical protein
MNRFTQGDLAQIFSHISKSCSEFELSYEDGFKAVMGVK